MTSLIRTYAVSPSKRSQKGAVFEFFHPGIYSQVLDRQALPWKEKELSLVKVEFQMVCGHPRGDGRLDDWPKRCKTCAFASKKRLRVEGP